MVPLGISGFDKVHGFNEAAALFSAMATIQ
jgi:hypothetical protein